MVSPMKRAFLAGLAAGGAALVLSLVIRLTVGGVFLPELAAQTLFTLTPGSVESVAVENLRALAKDSAFVGAVIMNAVLYGLIGVVYFRWRGLSGTGTRAEKILLSSFLAYFLLTIVGVALFFTTQLQSSPVTLPELVVTLVPPQFVFGGVLIWLNGATPPVNPSDLCTVPAAKGKKSKKGKMYSRRRRLFIRNAVAAGVGAAILAYGVSILLKPGPPKGPATAPTAFLSQTVTPTGQFYRVDVNIFPPSVNASSWSLAVSGLVSNPMTLSLSDLENMTTVEQYNTLECVSNFVAGNLIGTAQWTGVKLKDVLTNAGVQPSTQYIIFKAVDGYSVGIPIERAMQDGTLLAYEMNGAPLETEHGYPLRAIVPGLYGMNNCKWITSIEAVNDTYEGYWQQRGWAEDAMYQTGSSIVIPGNEQVDSVFGISGTTAVDLGIVPVAGLAFAGDRGISKVEISTDGGNTWTLASLIDPLSNYTWVFWTAQWNPPAAGQYRLAVRATDGQGNVQTAQINQPFPSGATGYDVVDISVSATSAT
ncbi:MAG: molybdopterin-dependent oxidoreductase [Thaumarchaeota archaeon]|nr:molybdopterin-dependent oxidoreductase [Nitrososphaerota archaeon]